MLTKVFPTTLFSKFVSFTSAWVIRLSALLAYMMQPSVSPMFMWLFDEQIDLRDLLEFCFLITGVSFW